eukprot:127774_1
MGVSLARTIQLFMTGMIAGLSGDGFHAYSKVLGYPSPMIFNLLPWWVPIEFGIGGIILGLGYGPIIRYLSSSHTSNSQSNFRVIIGLCLFLGSYLLSSYLKLMNMPDLQISCILGFLSLISWIYNTNANIWSLLLAIFVAVSGCLWENTLCEYNIFWYYQPDFLKVRHWIFWLWFTACTGSSCFFLKLEEIEKEKLHAYAKLLKKN